MFNKSKREWKKVLREQEKYRNDRIYGGSDIGEMGEYAVTIDGVQYHIDRPSHLVVDAYDEALGSIELSHHESDGFGIVDGYNGKTDTLDFTFIKPQDTIKINCGEEIKTVKINASNLRYAKINTDHPLRIVIVIDTDKIDTLLGEKAFVKKHRDVIKEIEYVRPTKSHSDIDEMLTESDKQEKPEGKSK